MKLDNRLSLLSAALVSALLLSGCFYGAAPEEDVELFALGEAAQELHPDKTGGEDIGGGSGEQAEDEEEAASDPQPEPRKPDVRSGDEKTLSAPNPSSRALPHWTEEEHIPVLPRERQRGTTSIDGSDD